MIRVRSVLTGVAGTPWYTNLYFDGTSSNAQAAADQVQQMWVDYSLAQLRTGVTALVESTVPTIDPGTGDITGMTTVSGMVGQNGTQSDEPLPSQTQVCASLRTSVYIGGREVRGKIYFPGLTIGSNSSTGSIEAGTRGNIAANVTFNLIAPSVPQLVVWSRKSGAVAVVTGVTVPSTWSVLRSRR